MITGSNNTKNQFKQRLDHTLKLVCGTGLAISGFFMDMPAYFTLFNLIIALVFSSIYAITYEEQFTFDFGEFLRATTICGTAFCFSSLVVEHDTSATLSIIAGIYLIVTIPNKTGKRWL